MIEQQRILLRQRRDLSEIIQAALQLYMQNPVPFLSIAALVIPVNVALAILFGSIDDPFRRVAVQLGVQVPSALVTSIATAALIAALHADDVGQPIEFGAALDAVFARIVPLVGATLRVFAVFFLLFVTIIGIPWAIRQVIRWVFVEQAVMLDGTGVVGTTDRSAELVIGSWWRTFGIVTVISVVGAIPGIALLGFERFAPIFVFALAGGILSALVLPFSAIARTLLYFDLSVRKEAVATATPE